MPGCWPNTTGPLPPGCQVLGRKVFSRVVAAKDAKEESWMEVSGLAGWLSDADGRLQLLQCIHHYNLVLAMVPA